MGERVNGKTEQRTKGMLERREGELCRIAICYLVCSRSPTCMDWECSRGHWGWSENVVIGIQLS